MRVTVQALLVSRDIPMTQVLSRLMEQSAIHAEICSDAGLAVGKLCSVRFEAVFVDFAQPKEALRLMATIQENFVHRQTILVVVSSSQVAARVAFRAGAHFVLEHPLTSRVASATLKGCYSFMLRERSRYFRCRLQVPVHGRGPEGLAFIAVSANLSEGGLALNTTTPVKMGERLDLRLPLPGISYPCDLHAEVCWDDRKGHIGVRFVDVPVGTQEILQSFLWERMREVLAEPLPANSSAASELLALDGT